MHPYLNNEELLKWCQDKGIHVTAYSPLGNVNPEFASCLEDPVIKDIASRVGKTPGQVRRFSPHACMHHTDGRPSAIMLHH